MPRLLNHCAKIDEVDLTSLDLLQRPVWIFDPADSRMVWGNAAAVRLWGYDSRAAFLAGDYSHLSPVVAERLPLYRQSFAKAQTVAERWPLRPQGNPQARCICSGAMLKGERLALLVEAEAVGHDADEELRTARDRLELLLSSTSDGVCGVDEVGVTTFFNAAATAITGWREADVIGRPIHSFLHLRNEDGEPCPLAQCPIYATFRQGTVQRVSEDIFWRKDGSSFPVEYVSSPMRVGDRIVGAVIIFRDITERREQERALRERTRQLEAVSASLRNAQRIARLGNWDWDIAEGTLWWSPEIYRIFGIASETFGATYPAFLDIVHPADRQAVTDAVDRALAGEHYEVVHRIVCPDGTEKTVQECGEVSFDEQGRPVRMSGTVQDVTEAKRREAELDMLWTAVAEAPVGMVIADRDGRIEYVNPAVTRMTGFDEQELIGNTCRVFKSGEHDQRFYAALWRDILAGDEWQGEICNRRKDGTVYWEEMVIAPIKDDSGEIVKFVAIKNDVTARREMQARIEHLAFHDPVTGLPNRSFFEKRLQYAEALCKRVGHAVAVLYIDLDGFKDINDRLGHAAGDRLLEEVAARLSSCIRETDVLARLGGDEFVALLLLKEGACAEASLVAARMIEKVNGPVMLDGQPVTVGASIGIAVYPDCGGTIQECLRLADVAMYDAKKDGKNRYVVFSEAK